MKHTKGRWYAVEYAGFWNIQDVDGYIEGHNLLNADSVGEERAEANALHIIECVNAPSEEKFIELCKKIEIYIQSDSNYRNSIMSGNFSTRFVKLYRDLYSPISEGRATNE